MSISINIKEKNMVFILNKKFLIAMLILLFISCSVNFAESDLNVTSTDSNHEKNIFIISDNPGTNIIDSACEEICDNNNTASVNFVVRSGEQIKDMNEQDLYTLFDKSDAFIGEWISTDVDSVLTNMLGKYPNLSHKELFLILEPPSGNLNSDSTSLNLIRNNTINYNKIFTSLSNDELIDYFRNTKRGTSYTAVRTREERYLQAYTNFSAASLK